MAFIDLFVQRDAPEQKGNQGGKQEAMVPGPMAPTSFTQQAADVSAVGSDNEIVGRIWDTIINKNLPGPDYLELKNNAAALEDMGFTEEQRLVAAFKMLKKGYPNFTKDVVIKSVDTYIGIVNEEKELGLKEVAQLEKDTVGEKSARLGQLRATANDILAQIDELKKRFDETNNSANTLEHEILTETQAINSKRQVFIGSIETVIQTLNSDKAKISTLNF